MKHYTHLKLEHLIRRLSLLFVLAGFIPFYEIYAQNLKPLGNGLADKVYCGCTDSLDNVYTVTQKDGDTAVVRKWNIVNKSWSVYASMSLGLIENQLSAQCVFLNNKLYVSAVFKGIPNYHQVWEYNGSSWTFKNRLRHRNGSDIKLIRFKDNIYFAGTFDSLTTMVSPQIVKFDGSSFSSTGLSLAQIPGWPKPATLAVRDDTLFMTYDRKVLFHQLPNFWTTYYSNWHPIYSMAVTNKFMFLSDTHGNVLTIQGGFPFAKRKDSVGTSWKQINMKGYKNRIFLTHRKSDYDYGVRFGEFRNRKIDYYFHNIYKDTSDVSMINANDQKFYYYSREGLFWNKLDYHHIGELKDTSTALGIDTIVVQVFKDKNKNNRLDTGGGEYGQFYIRELSSLNIELTNGLGRSTLYPLEDEDYQVFYLSEYLLGPDSCYASPYSGSQGSKAYNSPITRDTLWLPLRRKTLQSRNLVLRSWSSNRARLLDTTMLNLYVFNRDCDLNNAAATVTVTLDAKTDFVSSVPAYTSKNGNVLTYSLSNILPYAQSNIRMKVLYSNTKYSLGDKVRHNARLTTSFQEDTIDNRDSIVQKLVYSFDPNAKHSIPEGKINSELKCIRFHIDFQNLGTDDARRVTVVDTLDLRMPVYEYQMVASSHNYGIPGFRGKVVTWTFDNINLKPKSVNEAASKGFVIFDAMVDSKFRQGDSIRNKASIFFDYNEPVITNYSVITWKDHDKGVPHIDKPYTLIVYPNPAKNILTIDISYIGSQLITIYDMKGACIQSLVLDSTPKIIDTSHWARGIYVVVSSSGESVRVVIE